MPLCLSYSVISPSAFFIDAHASVYLPIGNSSLMPNAITSPFAPENAQAYAVWREQKLHDYPTQVEDFMVEINHPNQLSNAEHEHILRLCRKTNMALYRAQRPMDKRDVKALGLQFGLQRLDHNLCADPDGIAALQISTGGRSQEYIPYSNRPINWHTDGYYNKPEEQIRGMILHCARHAGEGGENAYLDHEIAYLLMRDENPDWITALMDADVMTIPANQENGHEIRPAQTGPVFSIDERGALHTRYTARSRNIEWKADPRVSDAIAFLTDLFHSDNAYIFRYRLNPNEGVISNNVLHNRTGFANGDHAAQQRLLYRARYFDRMANT